MEALTPESDAIIHERREMLKREHPDASTESGVKRVKEEVPLTREQVEAARQAEKQRRLDEREAEKQQKLQEKLAKKEAKEQERLKREAEREAEKQRKEEEKLQREAEKQAEKERKEHEKQLLKERKEQEKQQKEAEKQAEKDRKEAEKQAEKERKEAEKQAEKERKEAERLKAQPRINLFFKANQPPKEEKEEPAADDVKVSDYEKHILPFQAKTDGQVFDSVCNATTKPEERGMNPLEWLKTSARRAPAHTPPKLTSQQFQVQLALAHESAQIAKLLTQLRVRRLQFSHLSPKYSVDLASTVPINEEYRPPYVGTTQDVQTDMLRLDPFAPSLTMNYEYDSEVEWDGDDDGEDLRDEDGDDSDEDMSDQDELREFLSSDEDGASQTKRHKLMGPLTPVVLWDDAELTQFAGQLLGGLSIDPSEQEAAPASTAAPAKSDSDPFTTVVEPVCAKIGRPELRAALLTHNNSQATKTLIVELLKQHFPQALASEIRQVFDACMERVGKKRNEKRWVLTAAANDFFGTAAPENAAEPPRQPKLQQPTLQQPTSQQPTSQAAPQASQAAPRVPLVKSST